MLVYWFMLFGNKLVFFTLCEPFAAIAVVNNLLESCHSCQSHYLIRLCLLCLWMLLVIAASSTSNFSLLKMCFSCLLARSTVHFNSSGCFTLWPQNYETRWKIRLSTHELHYNSPPSPYNFYITTSWQALVLINILLCVCVGPTCHLWYYAKHPCVNFCETFTLLLLFPMQL